MPEKKTKIHVKSWRSRISKRIIWQMQQNPSYRRLPLSTLLTGLLFCWNPLFAADPLTDPDNTPTPVIDTVAPSTIALTRPAPFVDPDPNFYKPTQAIVTPDFITQITTKVIVTDEVEGNSVDFTFNPTGSVGPLIPGQYIITWTATDQGLNSTSVDQTLNVLPTVNLELNQQVGEGGTAIVTAHLSGKAPSYPVTIPYTVVDGTADSADHDAVDGDFVFNSDETEASISFSIIDDGLGDSGQTFNIDLGALPATQVFAGHKAKHTVTTSETNQAPLAHLSASQGGNVTRAVTISGGTITISADAYDANGDTIQYDWSATDNALAPTSGTTGSNFTFEPLGLTPGFYTVRLTVSDTDGLSSSHDILLVLLENDLELSDTLDSDDDNIVDATEGFRDKDNDGIPDYRDAIDDNSSLMQGFEPFLFNSDLKQQDTFVTDSIELTWEISSTASNLIIYPLLLEVDPGHHINIGPTAFAAGNDYARIATATAENLRGVTLDDNLVSSDGQVVDIEITHLNRAGDSALVVIPQPAPIPPSQTGSPRFIVFSQAKSWETFAEDSNNEVLTAAKLGDSYCPGLDSIGSYTGNTLDTGAECILLSVQDGGTNDYDGVANGTIRLMGAVFITSSSTSTPAQADDETFTGSNDATIESSNKLDLGTGDGGGSIGFISLFGLLIARLLRTHTKTA